MAAIAFRSFEQSCRKKKSDDKQLNFFWGGAMYSN